MTTPRAQKRQVIEDQILDLGRTQLATVGAAAISLRAIARELGMVSSAIYRYVDSRDELLTRLVVEAYTDLADHVDAAVDAAPATGTRHRVAVVAQAFRRWAITEPARYALLYGSPVPGYHAPADRTVEPGNRVINTLLSELSTAATDGTLRGAPDVSPALSTDFTAIRDEVGMTLTDGQFVVAITLWTWLIGAIGLEVFEGFGADTFTDPAAVFTAQLNYQLDVALR